MEKKEDFKILCPFCNEVYTAKMMDDLYAAGGCDTCGSFVEGTIEIKCSNCKKVV